MIQLDTKNYSIKIGHKGYNLTPKEFEVLYLLASADNYIKLTQAQKMALSRVHKKIGKSIVNVRLKIGYKTNGTIKI